MDLWGGRCGATRSPYRSTPADTPPEPILSAHTRRMLGCTQIETLGEPQYGDRMADTAATPKVTIVPANEASWEDLRAVLGPRGYHSGCWCQRVKIRGRE